MVSVTLTEGKNGNFTRGYPTKLSFFLKATLGVLRKSNKCGATERNNINFARSLFIFYFLYWRGNSSTN